jgi:hypothetical protein
VKDCPLQNFGYAGRKLLFALALQAVAIEMQAIGVQDSVEQGIERYAIVVDVDAFTAIN